MSPLPLCLDRAGALLEPAARDQRSDGELDRGWSRGALVSEIPRSTEALLVRHLTATRRELRNAGIFGCVLFLGMALAAYLALEPPQQNLWMLAAGAAPLMLTLGIPSLRDPRRAPLLEALRARPHDIVWLHLQLTAHRPMAGRWSRNTRRMSILTAGLVDGRRIHCDVIEGEDVAVLAAVAELAPDAALGFTPELEQAFTRDPESLRGLAQPRPVYIAASEHGHEHRAAVLPYALGDLQRARRQMIGLMVAMLVPTLLGAALLLAMALTMPAAPPELGILGALFGALLVPSLGGLAWFWRSAPEAHPLVIALQRPELLRSIDATHMPRPTLRGTAYGAIAHVVLTDGSHHDVPIPAALLDEDPDASQAAHG